MLTSHHILHPPCLLILQLSWKKFHCFSPLFKLLILTRSHSQLMNFLISPRNWKYQKQTCRFPPPHLTIYQHQYLPPSFLPSSYYRWIFHAPIQSQSLYRIPPILISFRTSPQQFSPFFIIKFFILNHCYDHLNTVFVSYFRKFFS